MTLTIEALALIATAIVGAVTGIVSMVRQVKSDKTARQKANVETTTAIAEAARGLIDPLTDRLDEQEKALEGMYNEMRRLRQLNAGLERGVEMVLEDNKELWRGVLILLKQLKKCSIEPDWTPSERIASRFGLRPEDVLD